MATAVTTVDLPFALLADTRWLGSPAVWWPDDAVDLLCTLVNCLITHTWGCLEHSSNNPGKGVCWCSSGILDTLHPYRAITGKKVAA